MRITNNIIMGNTKTNINSTKILVDKYNTQMTTQKKISKASEDPVIAIRSMRMATTLSHLGQYVDNNIPDARSWLDVTETSLKNMKSIITDIRTQCVNGSTDTLTADDRETILKQLTQLSKQVYSEGNSDYAGRTIFTGYYTSSNLTFMKDQSDTTYEISQGFTYEDLKEARYYTAGVTVPTTVEKKIPAGDDIKDYYCKTDVHENAYQRIRLAYGGVTGNSVKLSIKGADGNPVQTESKDVNGNVITDANGDPVMTDKYKITKIYDSAADFTSQAAGNAAVGDDDIIFIADTGELVFGANVAKEIQDNRYSLDVTYDKTGFEAEDARPEFYYNCINKTDAANPVKYKFDDQQYIKYTVATNTDIAVNTLACDVLDTSIKRDVDEMINIVQDAIQAHEKVDKIKSMMAEEQYSGEDSQKILQSYLDAAEQEASYADDNLQKTYGQYISNCDGYLDNVNLAISNVGSTESRISLIQTRVENQQTTIEELKSNNEDRDISDIIIDYYAMYNAYTASLTAASKVEQQTLLNYL